MEVQFYLSNDQVQRVFFKQFSSHCTVWLKLLDEHAVEISRREGLLKLIYDPCRNVVHPEYNPSDLFLQKLHAMAIESTTGCFVFIRSAPLVKLAPLKV